MLGEVYGISFFCINTMTSRTPLSLCGRFCWCVNNNADKLQRRQFRFGVFDVFWWVWCRHEWWHVSL